MTPTIFQRIIAREIPANIEYEDDEVIAIKDIAPKAPVHILVIPKKFIPSIADATDADQILLGKLILTAQKIAKEKGLEGYKLLFNVGEKGGQVVFHVHLHLLGGGEIDLCGA
ncbi:MAG: histidine triad nucleotide-binding protein [Candidatus Peregrinibacteria bacterium]